MEYVVLGIAIIHFLVAAYVFFHTPRTNVKVLYALAALQLSVWTLVHYFGQYIFDGNAEYILFFGRCSLISMLFFPSTYAMFFSRIVTAEKDAFYTFAKYSFVVPLLMLPFSFGDLNASGFYYDNISYAYLKIGALYDVYIPYFLVVMISAAVYLAYSYFREKESKVKKAQWGLLFSVTGVAALFGVYNNAILPSVFNLYSQPELGTLASVSLTLITAYAITRYRFMSILVAVKKNSFVFVVVFGLIAVVIFLWLLLALHFEWYAIAGLLFLVLGPWLLVRILQIIDATFFLDKLHLFKQVSEDAKKVSYTKEVAQLYQDLYAVFHSAGGWLPTEIFILQRQYNRFHNYFSSRWSHKNMYHKSVEMYISAGETVVLKEDIEQFGFFTRFVLSSMLRKRSADACIIVQGDNQRLGIIFLMKKNDDADIQQILDLQPILLKKTRNFVNLYEALIGVQRTLNDREYL